MTVSVPVHAFTWRAASAAGRGRAAGRRWPPRRPPSPGPWPSWCCAGPATGAPACSPPGAPVDPRRGGGRGRRPRRLAGRPPSARALPRGPAPGQRGRARLWLQAAALAGAVVVGRQPHPPGRRAGPRPRPHRVPAAGHLARPTCRWSTAATSGRPLGRVEPGPGRGSSWSTTRPRPARWRPYAGAAAARPGRRPAWPPSSPRLPALHLGHLRARPRPAGAPRDGWPASGPSWPRCSSSAPTTSATWPCPCSTPTPSWPAGAPALAAGAAVALPAGGRFSASGFLPDVRRFGATYFNYVGKPLAYVLATPERPDDADNPLVRAFGNEGGQRRRRAVRRPASAAAVTDAYGSTEGGATVSRTPDTPPGRARPGPRGHRGARPGHRRGVPPGPLRRAGPAAQRRGGHRRAGEPRAAGPGFEGYWRNDEAERARLREGWYWTGRPRLPRRRRASSTSPGGTTTGCGSTARTSPRPRSSGSSSATPTWCWPPSTPCPTRSWATR